MAEILVVDDEAAIADLVEVCLKNEGYTVYKCGSGEAALTCVARQHLDLAILDVMLPDLDGFTLCQKIREEHLFPILMLTARVEDMDKIMGLTLGADDYIVKPFEAVELLARIEVVLRRAHKSESLLTYEDIVVDVDRHTVTKNGAAITLTPREFELLVFFMQNIDIALTRERLLASVWGYRFEGESRTVDIHVQQLRRKMGLKGRLITIPKLGYRLENRRRSEEEPSK